MENNNEIISEIKDDYYSNSTHLSLSGVRSGLVLCKKCRDRYLQLLLFLRLIRVANLCMFTVIKSLDEKIRTMRAMLGPMARLRRKPKIVMGPVLLT